MLEFARKNQNKSIYIWGYWKRAEQISEYLKDNNISNAGYIISRGYDKPEDNCHNVYYIDEIERENSDLAVIISTKRNSYNSIVPQLVRAKIDEVYFLSGNDLERIENYNTYFEQDVSIAAMFPSRYKAYASGVKIFSFLQKYIEINSVIDFGCGSGAFLKAIKDLNPNAEVLGVDGSAIDRSEFLATDNFKQCNLATFKYETEKKYDLAISIEVAEHLDEEYADNFVDNLCKAADVVLFSAAIKYQGGDHHVNEQSLSYWKDKFDAREYEYIDCIRPEFWNDKEVIGHCKQNCILYVKKDRAKELRNKIVNKQEFREYVHPDIFETKMKAIYEGCFF